MFLQLMSQAVLTIVSVFSLHQPHMLPVQANNYAVQQDTNTIQVTANPQIVDDTSALQGSYVIVQP